MAFFPYRKTIQWVAKVALIEAFVSYSPLSLRVLPTCGMMLRVFWTECYGESSKQAGG